MKKARYDGPSGTGVDVLITFPDGQTRWIHVDQGHQLPAEMEDGPPIPASERDRLLATDDWTAVDVATGDKTAVKAAPVDKTAGDVTPNNRKEG
jgi:hypothetical protein